MKKWVCGKYNGDDGLDNKGVHKPSRLVRYLFFVDKKAYMERVETDKKNRNIVYGTNTWSTALDGPDECAFCCRRYRRSLKNTFALKIKGKLNMTNDDCCAGDNGFVRREWPKLIY